jgi:drug/metabolite transporter (DMT)-like permease
VVALASAVILSTTAIFIRYLTETYGMLPLVLALWRDGLVALSLLLALGLLQPRLLRLKGGRLRALVVFGLVLALFNSVWTLSVALNGAAIATVLVYSSPAFTAVLARWLLQEQLGWIKVVAVTLCIGGCVLVSGLLDGAAWQVNGLGIVTGVLSGLAYAIYSLMGRSAARWGMNPWTTLLYTFGFATVFLLVFNLLPAGWLPGAATNTAELLWRGTPATGWMILIALAAGPTLLGFGLYNVSLSLLPSSVANLILTLEPAFTALLAFALLGERFTGLQVGGGLMVLAGVVFLRGANGAPRMAE